MAEHTFFRRPGAPNTYEVFAGGRMLGTVTCVHLRSREWAVRIGHEERRCLDSQGEEITFPLRDLAAAVVVAAADVEEEGRP